MYSEGTYRSDQTQADGAGNWTVNIGIQQEGRRIKVYQDGIKGRPRSQDVYIFPF